MQNLSHPSLRYSDFFTNTQYVTYHSIHGSVICPYTPKHVNGPFLCLYPASSTPLHLLQQLYHIVCRANWVWNERHNKHCSWTPVYNRKHNCNIHVMKTTSCPLTLEMDLQHGFLYCLCALPRNSFKAMAKFGSPNTEGRVTNSFASKRLIQTVNVYATIFP